MRREAAQFKKILSSTTTRLKRPSYGKKTLRSSTRTSRSLCSKIRIWSKRSGLWTLSSQKGKTSEFM